MVLLFAGITIRILFNYQHGLSNDELSAITRLNFASISELINKGVKFGDMHPIFYHLYLKFWTSIFGLSDWSIRFSSLLFYVLNSILIYKISLKFFTKNTGLLLIAAFSFLSFSIYGLSYARPYNAGLFFILLTFLSLLEIKNHEEKSTKWFFLLIISFLGAVCSHYFASIVVFAMAIMFLFYINLKNKILLLLAGFISLVLFSPHFHITLHHLNQEGITWLSIPKASWIAENLFFFFNESFFLIISFCSLILLRLIFIRKYPIKQNESISYFVFFASYIFAFFISIYFTPILRDMTLFFFLPFLFFGIFFFLDQLKLKAIHVYLISLVFLLSSLVETKIAQADYYGGFRGVAEEVLKGEEKYGTANIQYLENYNNKNYIKFYTKKASNAPILDWENPEIANELSEFVQNCDQKYLVYHQSCGNHRSIFYEIIKQKYPVILEHYSSRSATYTLFSKAGKTIEKKKAIFYAKKGTIETEAEFQKELKLPVSFFRNNIQDEKDYFTIECNAEYEQKRAEIQFIVTAIRDLVPLKKNENENLYYINCNQGKLIDSKAKKHLFYLSFEIPDELKDDDTLQFYLWNRDKIKLKTSQFIINQIHF